MDTFSLDRRLFLGAGMATGLAALTGCGTREAADAAAGSAVRAYDGKLGVQLYTVRDLFEQDYAGTLKALADIGIKDCETAGYFEHDPKDVRAAMDDLGLVSNCAHVQLADMREDFEGVIETAQIMGQTNLILPWIAEEERTLDNYRAIADLLNVRGEEAKSAGMMVGYHNHEFEFIEENGESGYDILLNRTDSGLVTMEIDFFWVAEAGQDALALIERAPGRFRSCHIKDRAADGTMVPVGDGVIDFAGILAQADKAGLQHFYIEHDNPADPLASVARSYAHLTA